MFTSVSCNLLYPHTSLPPAAGVHLKEHLLGSPNIIMADPGLVPAVDIVPISQKMLSFMLALCSSAALNWNKISRL